MFAAASGSAVYMSTDDPSNFFRVTSSYAISPVAVASIPAGAQTVVKLNP